MAKTFVVRWTDSNGNVHETEMSANLNKDEETENETENEETSTDETSTEESSTEESSDVSYTYVDSQGNIHYLSRAEAEEMGLITKEEQTQNNPFQDLANQTDAGRHSDNEAELEQQEETTGSLNKEQEEKTDETESAYDGQEGANPGNTETGTEIGTFDNISNLSRSGVEVSTYIHAALGIAVGLTAVALAIKGLVQHGVNPTTTQRHRETKINAQSKRYFAVKSQYKKQEEFMSAKTDRRQTSIAKDINKVEKKIGKGKVSNKNNLNLVRAFSKGSVNKRYYKNNVIGDAVYDKKTLKEHRSAINDETKIANLSSKKQTKARSAKINKLKEQQEEKIKNVSLGTTSSSIHYAAKLPNMYSDMSAVRNKEVNPLYIHRAITDRENLNKVLDKAHKALPYADKQIKICKIDMYNTDGDHLMSLNGSFDNNIGYQVVKAALIKEVKELKAQCPEIAIVDVKESVEGRKTEHSQKEYNLNVDNSENNIADFSNEVEKADKTLNKFDALYNKTKVTNDLSL